MKPVSLEYIHQLYSNKHTQQIVARLLSHFSDEDGIIHVEKTEKYFAYLRKNHKKKTIETYYHYTQSLWNKLYKTQYVDTPFSALQIEKPKKTHIAPSLLKRIEKQDITNFIAALEADQKKDFALLVECLASTGMRIHEAKYMSLENRIEESARYDQIVIMGKGQKERIIYMPKDLYQNLETHLGKTPFHWISLSNINKQFKFYQQKYHLPLFTPHQLRSFYGTYLLEENKVEINLVSRLLGHSDINVTAKFYLRNRLEENLLGIFPSGLHSSIK